MSRHLRGYSRKAALPAKNVQFDTVFFLDILQDRGRISSDEEARHRSLCGERCPTFPNVLARFFPGPRSKPTLEGKQLCPVKSSASRTKSWNGLASAGCHHSLVA